MSVKDMTRVELVDINVLSKFIENVNFKFFIYFQMLFFLSFVIVKVLICNIHSTDYRQLFTKEIYIYIKKK